MVKYSRYIFEPIQQDLSANKMVFIGGPRQVGKTTLARRFIGSKDQYLNWDKDTDRALLLKDKIDISQKLLVLDEIHKYRHWRNLLKGYYDKFSPDLNFIVTGSAKLDHFRKGGDSLLGRYHYWRLHPLSLKEISKNPNKSDLKALLEYGGFPEPFISQSKVSQQRWQMQRVARVVQQDLRDLETVKDVSLMELLAQNLHSKVGSALSIKSLQEDLQVSPNTVERWVQLLEAVYYCYRISPFGPPKIKAVKKAQKLYMWDWSEVEDRGARFENLVAGQLLKFCHYQEDANGLKTQLRYFRDTVTEREIDFIVLQKGRPLFAVECKSGEKQLSASLVKNAARLKIPKIYQVHLGDQDFGHENTGRVMPFYKFCKELEMP